MSQERMSVLGAIVAAGLCNVAMAGPTPGETTVLGPFTGHYAQLHPDNIKPLRIVYYGTDLGFTYEHQGKLQIIFGDTSADEIGVPIQASTGATYDDGFGSIDLAQWPDSARIDRTHIPLIKLGQNAGTTEMSAINPGQPMEQFKTPLGGFSNGAREYGLFYTGKPQGCRVDADCSSGLTCDTGLGYFGTRYDDAKSLTFACMRTTPGCTANTMVDAQGKPIEGSGFCSDRTSSIWAGTGAGRVAAVGTQVLIGVRSTSDPRSYDTKRSWSTNKFGNVVVQSVQDFVPARGAGRARQDYRIPAGSAQPPAAGRRIFMWGRPGFIGVGARGRTLGLYFAYVDMPRDADFAWEPHYYSGSDAKGMPQFSRNEKDAVAVDLDSTRAGMQPAEATDIVDQESVVWVGHLGKWVLFFGGGMGKVPMPPVLANCGLIELFVGADCRDVVVGNGAIRMRTADDPWGPWTPAQDVIAGGDPDVVPLQNQYAAGGVLFHPLCKEPACVARTHSPALVAGDYGFFYGSNLIAQWIKPVGQSVDVIWNASTWDPYRVILLRTRINP